MKKIFITLGLAAIAAGIIHAQQHQIKHKPPFKLDHEQTKTVIRQLNNLTNTDGSFLIDPNVFLLDSTNGPTTVNIMFHFVLSTNGVWSSIMVR